MVSLLSEIIESDAQLAVLAFLLIAPERAFSLKELASRLKFSSDKTSQAVKELSAQNYLKTFSYGGLKFVLLNFRHQQIPLLRSEILKSQKPWQDELAQNLKKLGQLSGIFLSGIFVGQNSLPVDLLLVGKVNLTKLDQFLKLIQKQFGKEINYSIMSAAEFLDRRDTFDRFIKDIFDYPHVVILDNHNKAKKTSKKK